MGFERLTKSSLHGNKKYNGNYYQTSQANVKGHCSSKCEGLWEWPKQLGNLIIWLCQVYVGTRRNDIVVLGCIIDLVSECIYSGFLK
jgi:hypothetical protein